MKSQNSAASVKNSNTPAKPARPKLRVTSESTLVLTIFEKGAFKRHGFDEKKTKAERKAQRCKEREKMSRSWFISTTKDGIMVSRDGVNWRKKREGEHVYHFDAPGWVPPSESHEVKTQMHITNAALQYAVSADARPAKMSPNQWKSVSLHDKIEMFLQPIADGRKFTWEVLN